MKPPITSTIDDLPGRLIVQRRCTALILPLLLAGMIYSLTTHAAAPTRDDALFRTEVLVASQAPGELNRALPRALAQVLVRLTANPAINTNQWAQVAASKARTYLSQYQYEQRPSTDPANPGELTYLLCEFNPQAITQLLEQTGIAYWGQPRPTVVAWIISDEHGFPQIIDSNHPVLASLITQVAQQYGLDLVFPLMDLQEQGLVSSSLLWLKDTNMLADASARYGTQVFVLGQINKDANGGAGAEWLLSIDGDEYQWPKLQPSDIDSLLQRSMAAVSYQLFQVYSHQPLSTHGVSEIRITHINDAASYQRAWDYLAQLQGVVSVVPLSFAAGHAAFTIVHSGEWTELNRVIRLGDTLLPPPVTAGALTAIGVSVSATETPANDSAILTSTATIPSYRLNN